MSLRRRLLAGLILSFLVAWGTMVFFWSQTVREELLELHDAQLVQYARMIAALPSARIADLDDPLAPVSVAPRHPYERFIVYQVYDAEGRLLAASAHAPATALGGDSDGFSDRIIDDEPWRVFVLSGDDGRVRVHVGESCEIRTGQIHEILNNTLLPLVLGVPIAILLAWVMVGRSLRPLRLVSDRLRDIDRDLALDIDAGDVPPEVAPLVESLDGLLARLRSALESERRFTADAAHELRTPLATLRVQAQVAQDARGQVARDRALQGLIDGIDRASHLVNQMLILARSEGADAVSNFSRVDLAEVVWDVVGDFRSRSRERQTLLRPQVPDHAFIDGDRALLMSLVRNLVDNALRYGEPGTDVRLRLYRADADWSLDVQDRGPGIPQQERARVFERFHRGLGTEQSGSGLGLSIVQRVAELHGGRISLHDGPGGRGLVVRATFPAA